MKNTEQNMEKQCLGDYIAEKIYIKQTNNDDYNELPNYAKLVYKSMANKFLVVFLKKYTAEKYDTKLMEVEAIKLEINKKLKFG